MPKLLLNSTRESISPKLGAKHWDAFTRYNSLKKFTNLTRLLFEFKQSKTLLKSFPVNANVDVTNMCNLRCPLCATGVREFGRAPRMMEFDEFRELIDDVGDYLYELNFYIFGEPLLNRQLTNMVEYAHEKNIFTALSTNATLLNEETANGLISSGLDYLILSIDGLSQETYGAYRVGGDFSEVVGNVKGLIRCRKESGRTNPFVVWQFLVFKHNLSEVDQVEAVARGLGVNDVTISSALGGENHPDNIIFDADRSKLILDKEVWTRYAAPEWGGGKVCDFLWFTLNMQADGGIPPCCLGYRKYSDFGDYIEENFPFHEIWNNAKFQTARRIFQEAMFRDEPDVICRRCFVAKDFVRIRGNHLL